MSEQLTQPTLETPPVHPEAVLSDPNLHEPGLQLQSGPITEAPVDQQPVVPDQTAVAPIEQTPQTFKQKIKKIIGMISLLGSNPDGTVTQDVNDEPKAEVVPAYDTTIAIERFKDHDFVREAPVFTEQLKDKSRKNPIEYVYGARWALGTRTEGKKSMTLTEYESINALDAFLLRVIKKPTAYIGSKDSAESMHNNLTFIGKQEYDEATAGIAAYWKSLLNSNPSVQLLPVVGVSSSDMVKSDAYLLDNILKNFSDDEINEYKGRLVADPEALTADPNNVRVFMLDDWTISGSQIMSASAKFGRRNPQYKDCMEILLIAAPQDRLNEGIEIYVPGENEWDESKRKTVPVKAYFKAHKASKMIADESGAHVTGAHCAVDYDFNNDIEKMALEIGEEMPPATNIVRPYRKKGVRLTQVNRLKQVKGKKQADRDYVIESGDQAGEDWF